MSASARSAASTRSRGRSRTSPCSSAWVPTPTTRPRSSTTIWSACRMVLTRWATMITRRVAGSAPPAPPAAGRRWRSPAPRSCRRRCRSAGGAPGPGRSRSRCRCPPETFAPPWSISELEPLGHLADEVAACAVSSASQTSVVGGVRRAEPDVGRHRAAEQERLLRHQPDAGPQVLLAQVAHVDPVDQHRAAGHVVQPRDQVDQRGLARRRCCRRSPWSGPGAS